MSELEMTKESEEKDAIDIVEETQDYKLEKSKEEFKLGDKVVHSSLYISVCRGNVREQAKTAVMEVIGLTNRSVTTRPWGSTQKYGPQFDRRYIKRAG
jgi:hypothetical protein